MVNFLKQTLGTIRKFDVTVTRLGRMCRMFSTMHITMPTSQNIIVTKQNNLTIIKYNRPAKKNAFNTAMYEEVIEALQDAADDETCSVTVVTGAGDCYSAGNDFSDAMKVDLDINTLIKKNGRVVEDFVKAFIDHPKILIAMINGPAIGIGATTAALCDIVYCTPNALFSTPFVRLGMSVEGCSSYTFPRILGTSKASEMLYFGKSLSAAEALQLGFVSEIIPKDQMESVLLPKLEEHANDLPAKSLVYSKELVRKFNKAELHEANREEFVRLRERWTSEDFANNIMKSMIKRSKL